MNVRFLKSAVGMKDYPERGLPRVAFAGRSNVGKSSLINSLVGRKGLARCSSSPGRTQVINFFDVEERWMFVDLPGYGFAKAPAHVRDRWGPMIEEFLTQDEDLKLCIMVVDARHKPKQLDLVMGNWLEECHIPYQVVATKVDKVSSSRVQRSMNRIHETLHCSVIPYSAATGIGKDKLWQIIERI